MIFSQFSSLSAGKKIALFTVIGVFLLAPVVLYVFSQIPSASELVDQQPPKPTLAPFPKKSEYLPDQLIVKFKSMNGPDGLMGTVAGNDLEKSLNDIGVESWQKVYPGDTSLEFSGYYILYFKKDTDVEKVAQTIYALPEVSGIEPNIEAGINK